MWASLVGKVLSHRQCHHRVHECSGVVLKVWCVGWCCAAGVGGAIDGDGEVGLGGGVM